MAAKPEILSLSVVDDPCGPGSAPRWLRCEFQGYPLPKMVWLTTSRRLLEPQGHTTEMGPYRQMSCVPYPEDEVLTCRVESRLGDVERTYPTSDSLPGVLTIVLAVAGLVVMLVMSTGLVCFCWSERLMQH